MENDSQHYVIVIIGGGPAGIATALTLQARGISHCIVEANTEPSNKPGEAIPPNARPLMRQLGVESLLSEDRTHAPYYGNLSSWGSAELIQEEFIENLYGHGYLLNRRHFEGQMQSLVKSQGTDFYSGYRLSELKQNPKGIQVKIVNDQDSKILSAKMIVDATGRKASVCRRLGIQKHAHDDQFALTFQVATHVESPLQIIIEAVEDGWWYAAPFDDGQMTLMFFTAKSLLPQKEKIDNFINVTYAKSLHLQEKLGIVTLEPTDVKVIPAGTSSLDIPFGENWLAVGDAAYSYDPISSYGITSALAAGYYAGHALADHISNKEGALSTYRYIMEKAFQGYLEKLFHQYDSEKRWSDDSYWKNRFPMNQPEFL